MGTGEREGGLYCFAVLVVKETAVGGKFIGCMLIFSVIQTPEVYVVVREPPGGGGGTTSAIWFLDI